MSNILLIDRDQTHAQLLEQELNRRGLIVFRIATIRDGAQMLKSRAVSIDLVVLAIADFSQPWLEILYGLQQAAWHAGICEFPLFLCASRVDFGTEFQLKVEQMGARLAIE